MRCKCRLIVLLAMLFAVAWNDPAIAATEYDFLLIEAFEIDYDLREVMLRDINEFGFVSGSATHESSYGGFVWTASSEKVLVPLSWPRGINNANQVVDNGTIYDFDSGEVTNVPAAGAWPIPRLESINDQGIAVGYSECSCSNSNRVVQEAMVWESESGSRITPIASAKELLRINNRNLAVGNIRGGVSVSEGFRYHVHTHDYVNLSDLLPMYQFSRAYSELQDINENDVVCGRGFDGQVVRGLIWSDAGGFTFLPAIPGGMVDRVYPRGINSTGTVVGFADLTPYNPRAFIWDGEHGTRNLNDLVEAPANFILDWAIKINDRGWIVGIGHYGPDWDTSRGFVLVPRIASDVADLAGPGARPSLSLLTNPVSDRLALRVFVPQVDNARLSIFDLAGRRVAQVGDVAIASGDQTLFWSPPRSLASGVYIVRLDSGAQSSHARFVLLR